MSGSREGEKMRLSAVLMADIVGYTKLVERNTAQTVATWKEVREDIIDPTIKEMQGRIVKLTGDGFLAEFPTIQDAVNCAIGMQTQLESSPLDFRMGVNLGDVIDDGEDIHGEGVNIAARIEALADPGSIAISGSVFEQVRNRISANYTDMGERKLKHVSAPVHVFQITNFTQPVGDGPQQLGPSMSEATKSATFSNKLPRILVAPFRNSSRNDDSNDIVEGIVEDLTTELSQLRSLEVVSNGASATLGGLGGDDRGLHAQHGIDFVLTGSIRSSGSRIRVSVELLDSVDGTVVWSERFSDTLDDIFEIQDRIVTKTLFYITGEIEVKTLDRAHRKPTENMTSYELLVKGKRLHHQYTKDTHILALDYFNKAIAADPENGSAHAWKACTIGGALNKGFLEPSDDINMETLLASIAKAKELNANDFECYRMLCRVSLVLERDHEKSLHFGKKAYDLNPNDPRILWAYGLTLALTGDGEMASTLLLKAEQLSPNFGVEGTTDVLWSALVVSTFVERKYEQSLEWFRKLDNVDFRSFILSAYSAKQCGSLDTEMQSHVDYVAKFRAVDHHYEIDNFLFTDFQVTEHLKDFSAQIFGS
tara:strand:- start:12440 stop:14221 length:1782 start_codon:yes stop_codon:yes gene_type:complete